MAILSVALSILMVVFIRHVSENVETYSNAGNLVVRSIIFLFGISSGTLGGFFFSRNVAEPSWLFGSGFVLGPLLAVMACVYVITALFFSLEQVRGLLRYSFRYKLNDNIPD